MLPPKIESLMREQIDVNLRSNQFRPPRFDQRALGKSFNGGTLQPSKLVHALWGEIDLLGNIVLEAMRKVVSSAKLAPYSGITEDLLQVFESEVELCMESIRRIGGEKLARISGPSGDRWFNRKADVARAAWKVDIKLMGIELGNPKWMRRWKQLSRRHREMRYSSAIVEQTKSGLNACAYTFVRWNGRSF